MKTSLIPAAILAAVMAAPARADTIYAAFRGNPEHPSQCVQIHGTPVYSNPEDCTRYITWLDGDRGKPGTIIHDYGQQWIDECDALDRPSWRRAN